MTIIQNAVYVPEQNVYLKSANRHDYIVFESQGDSFFIDGGNEYLRRSFRSDVDLGFVDYTLTNESSLQEIYDKLLWGTYGKKGNEPLRWLPIRTLEESHLKAILNQVPNVHPLIVATIRHHLSLKQQSTKKVWPPDMPNI